MRKTLFALMGLISTAAFAQNDLALTMDSPTPGQTLGPGVPFDFAVTITNQGSQDVTASDTVFVLPTINGGTLQDGNGQTIAIGFTGTTITGSGGTHLDTLSFSGLNIQGASQMNIDFCGEVFAIGPNWTGIVEDDTANNVSCATVDYDPNGGGMSIAEDAAFAEVKAQVQDYSFFANGTYNLDVRNVLNEPVTLSFVDLTGRSVLVEKYNEPGKELRREIDLEGMKKGILLAVLEVNGQVIKTRKILVQ